MRVSFLNFSIFFSYDQFQPGPHFIHRADFDIHHSEGQGHHADDVFSDIGGNLGRLLWPRNPDHGVVAQRFKEAWQGLAQHRALGDEQMHDIGITDES